MAKIREYGNVNDMVLYRNACEERKLKFTLSQIDRLKEQYSREQEKAKMYFAVQHLTVPSPTRRLTKEREMNTPKQRSASAPVRELQRKSSPGNLTQLRCRSLSDRIKRLDIRSDELDDDESESSTSKTTPFLRPVPSKQMKNTGWDEHKYPAASRTPSLMTDVTSVSLLDSSCPNVKSPRSDKVDGIRRASSNFSKTVKKQIAFDQTSSQDSVFKGLSSPITKRRATKKLSEGEEINKRAASIDDTDNRKKRNNRKINFFQKIMPPIEDWTLVPNLDEWYAKSPVKTTVNNFTTENCSTLKNTDCNSQHHGGLGSRSRMLSTNDIDIQSAVTSNDGIGGELSELQSKIAWERMLMKYSTPQTKPISKSEQRAKNRILREKWKESFKEMKSLRHSTFRAKVFDANDGESMTFVKFLPRNIQSTYIKEAQFAQRFL